MAGCSTTWNVLDARAVTKNWLRWRIKASQLFSPRFSNFWIEKQRTTCQDCCSLRLVSGVSGGQFGPSASFFAAPIMGSCFPEALTCLSCRGPASGTRVTHGNAACTDRLVLGAGLLYKERTSVFPARRRRRSPGACAATGPPWEAGGLLQGTISQPRG